MLDADPRVPETTGCGRFFDAACALLGLRDKSGYEGEAPMVLESLVSTPTVIDGAWHVTGGDLDLLPLLGALAEMEPGPGADAFHGTLAAALVDWATPHLAARGARAIVAGGGCVINAALSDQLAARFATRGVELLLPRAVPPGDGGLALGQAWVCAHALIPSNHAARAS